MNGPRLPSQSGLSLVELALVVATIALLAGILVPVMGGEMVKAKNARARADMRELASAFTHHHDDVGTWPVDPPGAITTATESLTGYPCLYANVEGGATWNGPYLSSGSNACIATPARSGVWVGFVDPWRRPYRLFSFANGYRESRGALILLALGPDGKLNTSMAEVFEGDAQGDDQIFVVTRKL